MCNDHSITTDDIIALDHHGDPNEYDVMLLQRALAEDASARAAQESKSEREGESGP
jgi:hypothetical protein